MTTAAPQGAYYPPASVPTPARAPRRHRGLKVIGGFAVVLLAFLAGVGAGGSGSTATGAAPAACIDALDAADQLDAINSEAFTRTGEVLGITDAAAFVTATNELTAYLTEQTPIKQDAIDTYVGAREACRSAG